MWCESPSWSHAGTRSSLLLPVSLPRLLSLGGDASLDAGQLINCRKINVLEAALWLRGCLLFYKTQHAVTYRILTWPCWLPALLAFGFGWGLAFLSAECLCCRGEGGLWCPGEGSWSPVSTALCFLQDCTPSGEQRPVVSGYLHANGRNTPNVAIAFWMVLVRLFCGEDDEREVKGHLPRGGQVFLTVIFVQMRSCPAFS